MRHPLCDTISKGHCAIWGGISHWAAKGASTPEKTTTCSFPYIDICGETQEFGSCTRQSGSQTKAACQPPPLGLLFVGREVLPDLGCDAEMRIHSGSSPSTYGLVCLDDNVPLMLSHFSSSLWSPYPCLLSLSVRGGMIACTCMVPTLAKPWSGTMVSTPSEPWS